MSDDMSIDRRGRTLRMLAMCAVLGVPATATLRPAAAASVPLGQWRVEAVHVDSQRERRVAILPDDPMLVGRQLSSTADRLSLAGTDGDVCEGPSATEQVSSLARLIAYTMGARSDGVPAATPADYGLTIPEGRVTVHWIACRSGRFGPSDFSGHPGAWLVQTGQDLLVGWADQTVLTAVPVNQSVNGAPPTSPSFDCARADTPSEKAICQLPDLAADDRSVAAAYGNAVYWCDKDPGKLALLAKVQKSWRVQRDICGGDATCLGKSMTDQTAKLGDPSSFLGD